MEKTVESEKKQQQRVYGDRFMPMRAGNNWSDQTPFRPEVEANPNNDPKRPNLYAELLNNEAFPNGSGANTSLLHYRRPTVSTNEAITAGGYNQLTPQTRTAFEIARIQKLEELPNQERFALTAPGIVDNFYYNLLDWSRKNLISLGLNHEVYTKKAFTLEPAELCPLVVEGSQVSAIKWNERGDLLAIGSSAGTVQIYDATRQQPMKFAHNHLSTVTSIAWHGNGLVSGDRDGFILQSDIRCPNYPNGSAEDGLDLKMHSKQVCNLKFSPDGLYLASSGGEGRICIWNNTFLREPVSIIEAHQAAIKALDWSPHGHGTLASGGGHRDTSMSIWNVLYGIEKYSTITGAQVCNLAWSPNGSKLVTTHGFGSNSIKVWDYPSMKMVSNLEGHQRRVQYMAVAPFGEGIVTAGSDESLRFWKVFSANNNSAKRVPSKLNLFTQIR